MTYLLKYISSSSHCGGVETLTRPAVLSALSAQHLSGGIDGVREPGLLGRMADSKLGQGVYGLSLEPSGVFYQKAEKLSALCGYVGRTRSQLENTPLG